ncbi:MAG: hypothetical protein WBZ36_25650 [Candidatus Nitrosopolaris sp.]
MLRKLNINENRQADLTVHGGEDKAIYTYPKKDQEYRNYRSEYYELYFSQFNKQELVAIYCERMLIR